MKIWYQSYVDYEHGAEYWDELRKHLDAITDPDAQIDAILLDLKLPDMYGLDLLSKVIVDDDPPPVIVITAHGSVNVAVEAMQAHASEALKATYLPHIHL